MSADGPPTLHRIESFLPERERLTRDQFLAKHPNPVLIVPLAVDGGMLEDDGAFHTQQLTSGLNAKPAGAAPRVTAVIPVSKRMADAFPTFIWVGRESRCDVTLPFTSVSKLQAQFVKRPTGEYDLLDAGSTNGTFVNGAKLEKNKPVPLKDLTQLRFGKIDVRFRTADGFYEELGQYL